MTYFSHRDWLNHKHVEFSISEHKEASAQPFIVNPVELQLSDDSMLELRDSITLLMLDSHSKEKMLEREPLLMQNLLTNTELLDDDGDVRQLRRDERPRRRDL